ncbi:MULTISPECIES: TetR/AcrR family transcriptional regulator [Acinetobacter]|uniref:TetR/AcrR family transcriptional regulator n=1 Tax=Acinetobacter TaxID=469 RepID=UPI000D008C89|nr:MULTISPECIES: TetR/AcrR family transcriptional regulator [Acinetobacter]MCS4297473.1 TetR/AcrR family transcriptional repressor of nem operon [Acinetobacter guillouiae]MCW2249846.1 TetR/AcrR family transcriptional repressor of nem operon [Acinetobacter sp. BIGb0204]NII38950.1 TetR/AcrR family transcriptional repressor of nem operon [Acinetobacter sp. BIGb0196]QLD61221.1 TetR/AcrR family transcriptional regulator [Acinetobacter sp. MYb10]
MKRSDKSEATRQHILNTSFKLVLHKGFVGVGLQEILTTCGVPKGSFYYYFTSKEAFGCALLQQYLADYKVKIDQLILQEERSAYARLVALWQAWIDDPCHNEGGWAENCLIVKLAAEVSDLSEDMRQILNFGVSKLTERIANLLSDGQQDGSIPQHIEPEKMAQTMYQLWLGAALLAKLAQNKQPLYLALETTQQLLKPI